MDPLTDQFENVSPYNYAMNNPIRFIDVGGEYPWPVTVRSFISTPTTGVGRFYGDGTASFDFSHSGKDPITSGLITPELDLHTTLSFNENLKKGVLSISGSFSGDIFPSSEAFITDQSGKGKIFLGAQKERGGLLDLFGDNKKSLFKVDMKVQFDKDGNFTGVRQGKANYTVDEWNKRVQEGFNK